MANGSSLKKYRQYFMLSILHSEFCILNLINYYVSGFLVSICIYRDQDLIPP